MTKSTPILIGLSLLVATAAWSNTPPLNIEKALAAQYQLAVERPLDSMVHNDLGNLLSLVERFGEAESAYRKAKELDPVDPAIRFNLGLLLQQTGRLDDANEEYYALLELEPDHAWAHYQLGTVAYSQGKTKAAKDLYAQSFAIDPTLSFAKHNPHVIDNPLATEALLLSGKMFKQKASRVPRQYAEGNRIADLMLEEPPQEAEAERRTGAEEDRFEELEEREGDRRSADTRQVSQIEGTATGSGSASGSSRVLTNEDLDAVEPVGQAGNRNARSRSSSRYSTSSRGRTVGAGATVGIGERRQGAPSRYRPGDPRRNENNGGNAGVRPKTPGTAGIAVGQPVQRIQPSTRPDLRGNRGVQPPSAQPQGEDESVPSVQRRRYRPGSNSTAAVRLKVLGHGR